MTTTSDKSGQHDRKLLELAAKAAGYSTEPYFDGEYMGANRYEYTEGPNAWNPLTDDGDALRLAAKLNMGIRFEVQSDGPIVVCSLEWSNTLCAVIEDFNKDPYTATRRAIVRAAAEIGKTL